MLLHVPRCHHILLFVKWSYDVTISKLISTWHHLTDIEKHQIPNDNTNLTLKQLISYTHNTFEINRTDYKMMPHIWHRKTYKEKLDYHWHLLTSNMSHKRHYKHMCSLSVSKGICGADDFSYVNIYIHLIFMYPCMNLHVSTCWSKKQG